MKDILIKLREDNRYTQTAMAKLLGISRQAYMKYETGEVEPPVEVIRKLKEIYGVTYEMLIDNRTDLLRDTQDHPVTVYPVTNDFQGFMAAEPSPAYNAKKTIQNSSLEEFATMLFSVAASLESAPLTLEEKLTKYTVYAKLAEAQMDIANGDKGEDIDTVFTKVMGKKWAKKHIK